MRALWISMAIGIAAGIIDIVPMIAQRLSLRSIISAFLQYLFAAIIIAHIKLPGVPWFIQGSIVAVGLALPIIIIISETDRTAPYIIAVMAVILGTLISIATHYWK